MLGFLEHLSVNNIVYFGSLDQLEPYGDAEAISRISKQEKYSFSDLAYNFYYNIDPTCRESIGLSAEKEYIVFYNYGEIA